MEKAVEEQEFLKAQQFKEQINVAEAEKEVLLNSVESSDLETLQRFATPKSSLKKVAEVARSVFLKGSMSHTVKQPGALFTKLTWAFDGSFGNTVGI